MLRLLETIKVENGIIHHLPYHEQRIHCTQRDLFGKATITRLADQIAVPEQAQKGLYKCRIIYQHTIEQVEFIPYQHRSIRTLRRVYCNTIDYRHKYEDRRSLNELFARRGDCDDILIIKNGLVTDTSYANIAFFDGQRWVTPAEPLLRGTQRQYLLDRGMIEQEIIREADLSDFQQFRLINALLGAEHPAQDITYLLGD